MFDPDSEKSRASGFSLDGFGNVRDNGYFSMGDGLGSIAPSQLSRAPDDIPRMDSHAMDWTPTPTGHASHFHHSNHTDMHDQEDLIDFGDVEPTQAEISGVGRLVAQFESKDYVPPLPPRPIVNTAPSPAETNPSLTNSSFSSYFGSLTNAAHTNHMPSPVGSPVESHYGSFGNVLSRIASPQDINSMDTGSPLVSFGGFADARISSPHISAFRSHVPGLSQFGSVERNRTPFGAESRNDSNPGNLDKESDFFGDVERNIVTFLKNELDGGHRQQDMQPVHQDQHQPIQHVAPKQLQQLTQQSTLQFNHQPAKQVNPQSTLQSTQQSTRQQNQQHNQQQQNHRQQSTAATPTTTGTPGFSIWRPPASPEIKQESPTTSPVLQAKSIFEKPPIPPKPKPIANTPNQFTLDFSSVINAKGKAPVKPPKPPKPPRSRLQLPPPPPPRPQADAITFITSPGSEHIPATPATPATPSTATDITSPGPSTLRQAVSAFRGPSLRPGRELVPAETWEQHKGTIRALYLDDRKPLKEVMSIMAEKYNFQATPKMYKTRFSQWGFVKNNTEDEVKKLLSMKFQRDAEGKISEFVRNGRVVNLGTYLKRKGVTEYDLIDFEQPADLPAHIRCRTPTPPPAPVYFRAPDLVRAQELLVGNIRKAFLQCRQFESDINSQVGWTTLQAWGAWSSDLLLEANFFFEALDADTGGQCLMRAFKQLEEDLKTLTPLGIFELLSGMVNRDLGLITALCKYLAAHSTTNLERSHPLRVVFGCLYDVQQKHGAAILSELLWGCAPLVANELEAIYGRRHPYVVRAWLDLAYFNSHVNIDRLQKIALELRVVQKQLEQQNGTTDPEVLIVRYAILQLMYATEPRSDDTKHATTELWHTLKSMKVLFRIRDSKSNAYCFHSPVRLNPWTKRCRRRYDAAVAIFEDHLGVKLHPYFEEDLHTSLHELEAHDSFATALEQSNYEFDVLFLRQQGVKFPKWHLTGPIQHDTRVRLSYGASVAASDLIGKQILERTVDSKGNAVVIHEPTLSSYIVNSERSATPIYPSDAETIVSLLDLNLTRAGESDEGDTDAPFEVFEAGTGMGSLSLHLARAMHAANPPVPANLRHLLRSSPLSRNVATSAGGMLDLDADEAALLSTYKDSRRAILQTLDRNGKHTRAAYKFIRNFRRAQYLADMDFHVGSIDDYISARLEASGGQPVFSRAVLDLPSAHEHAEKLIQALHPNAVLILFNPSISQIAEFQSWAVESKLSLQLEKVLELPTTSTADGVRDGGCGGRHWDVKIITPKAVPSEAVGDEAKVTPAAAPEPVLVMRPKVGGRVAGGGFIAVYRKWPAQSNQPEAEEEEPENDMEQ